MPRLTDSSGEGNHGTYDNSGALTFGVPGIVAGDTAVDVVSSTVQLGAVPVTSGLLAGDFWIVGWASLGGTADTDVKIVEMDDGTTAVHLEFKYVTSGSTTQLELIRPWGTGALHFDTFTSGASSLAAGPHMFAVVYETATDTATFFVDGAVFGTPATGSGHYFSLIDETDASIGQGQGSPDTTTYDEIAWGTQYPAPTILSTDSFNRANAASLGSTDGPGSLDPLTWVDADGTTGISGAAANWKTLGGSQGTPESFGIGAAVAYVDLGTANADLQLKFTSSGGGNAYAGLMFRYVNNNNYWIWAIKNNAGAYTARLWKLVSGTWTAVGSAHTGAAVADILRVVLNGSSIVTYRNGVVQDVVTDSAHSTATKHGLYNENTSCAVDAWQVGLPVPTTAIADLYAAASVDFATYTAAMLAFSPTGYYHLNEIKSSGWYVDQLAMSA